MAIQLQTTESSIWRIVQAIIQLVNGRHNASGQFTLSAGASTTTVIAPNCSDSCSPQYSPATAHAAAEVGNGTMFISAVSKGSFTVTHANNAQADRTFYFTCTGG